MKQAGFIEGFSYLLLVIVIIGAVATMIPKVDNMLDEKAQENVTDTTSKLEHYIGVAKTQALDDVLQTSNGGAETPPTGGMNELIPVDCENISDIESKLKAYIADEDYDGYVDYASDYDFSVIDSLPELTSSQESTNAFMMNITIYVYGQGNCSEDF